MDVQAMNEGRVQKRINYRKRKRMWFFASIVALPILQFCICYIYVNINSFLLAFQHYELPPKGQLGYRISFAGFENFKQAIEVLFGEKVDVIGMFGRSLQLFFWTTGVGLTLALLFSYYIYKKYPMSGLFRVVLFMPKILSGVVFCLLYKCIANDVYKYIGETFFGAEHVLGILDNQETQLAGVLFFSVWVGFGVNVLMFSGSMSGIDEAIVESAHLDGANTVQEFWYISIPMIWPTFVSFLTINLAGLFTDQMHLHTLFGQSASGLETFGYYLFMQSKKSELVPTGNTPSFSVLAAMGLMMTAIMLPLTLGARKALRTFGPRVD